MSRPLISDDDYTMGDLFRAAEEARKARRAAYGVDCPQCNVRQPKRIPTVLLPEQQCKVCGYRDPRKRKDYP